MVVVTTGLSLLLLLLAVVLLGTGDGLVAKVVGPLLRGWPLLGASVAMETGGAAWREMGATVAVGRWEGSTGAT